jgi:hypothetical protein
VKRGWAGFFGSGWNVLNGSGLYCGFGSMAEKGAVVGLEAEKGIRLYSALLNYTCWTFIESLLLDPS